MYAVFSTIMEAKAILAGRRFTVLSDHKALVSSSVSASARIDRWKLALQEFDFEIKYIEGVNNSTADLLSRRVALVVQEAEAHLSEEVEESELDLATEENLELQADLGEDYNDDFGHRQRIIGLFHNSIKGHLSREPTVTAIRAAGFDWPKLRGEVQYYIHRCAACKDVKIPRPEFLRQPFTLSADQPGEEWSADILQFDARDRYNFKYVIVVIGNFSRFCHLRAVKSLEGGECREILRTLFLQWGAPRRFRTDNGSQLRAHLTDSLLREWGIEPVDTPAYSSQSNGIAERAIRSVRELMGTIIAERGKAMPWSHWIPLIQFQMNSRQHVSTGLSPADLLLGKANSFRTWTDDAEDTESVG